MANIEKNIIITPNIGSSTDDPKIVFSAANTTTNAANIIVRAYSTSNGTLSIEGGVGQLFSVTNTFTGTIFSVNDVSGIPSIEVLDTGQIKMAQYSGNVSIFSTLNISSNTIQNGVINNRTISRNLAKGTVMANLENLSATVNAAGYPLVNTVTGNMDVFWSWKQMKSGTAVTGGTYTGSTMTTTPLSIGIPVAIGSGGDTVEVNLYEQSGINFYRIYYYQMLTGTNSTIIIEKIA